MYGKASKAGKHFSKPGRPYKAHNAGHFRKPGNIPQSLLSYKALAILWPYIEYVKIMSFILHYKNIYCSPLFADEDAAGPGHNGKWNAEIEASLWKAASDYIATTRKWFPWSFLSFGPYEYSLIRKTNRTFV